VFTKAGSSSKGLPAFRAYPLEYLVDTERTEKLMDQSAFQYFLNFDDRKRLGSGDVQYVTVRHGW
jgi:hypothetical protein